MLSTIAAVRPFGERKEKARKAAAKGGTVFCVVFSSLSVSILPFSLCLVSSLPFFAKGMQGAKDCGVECMVEVYCSKGEEGKCETGF